jgi:hypothetical protein
MYENPLLAHTVTDEVHSSVRIGEKRVLFLLTDPCARLFD